MPAKKTLSDFIHSAKSIYGNKYDYSKVIYKNTSTKVEIICPKHGSFFKTPSKFINAKQECRECGGYINWTWDKFVKKANVFHKNKYTYPKQTFINTKIKHKIICPVHGEFMQSIFHHLRGGCNQCGIDLSKKKQRDTKEIFINKSREIHGDKYDYSKVEYHNSQAKVIIVCKEHGGFNIKANNHSIQKQGCPQCGRIQANENIRKSWEVAKGRFERIHGDEYQYIEETYVDFTTKMTVVCAIHGNFEITPHSHYSMGAGCRECGIIRGSDKNKHSLEEVLIEFNNCHNNLYEYDYKSYKSVGEDIRIKCKKHGWFEQQVHYHKSGGGCKECSYELIGDRTKITLDKFIKQSIDIHGDYYDYSKVKWINQYSEILIGCPKPNHGYFKQVPREHKRGSGCTKCNYSRGERAIFNWLKQKKIEFVPQYTFPNLRHKNLLRCDFYLPDYNLVIEYNGLQHYKAIEHFGGEKSFKKTKMRDVIKETFCKESNIGFRIIRYDEDVNIEMNKIITQSALN